MMRNNVEKERTRKRRDGDNRDGLEDASHREKTRT